MSDLKVQYIAYSVFFPLVGSSLPRNSAIPRILFMAWFCQSKSSLCVLGKKMLLKEIFGVKKEVLVDLFFEYLNVIPTENKIEYWKKSTWPYWYVDAGK